MADLYNPHPRGLHIAVGSGLTIFLVGAVFWAGATYNRIASIEQHLASLDIVVAKLADVDRISDRVVDHERRVEKLEDQVRQLK